MEKKRVLWTELLLSFAAVLIADRMSKLLALNLLGESLPLIPGIFHLTLTINTGAAFSILSGKNTFLIFLSVLVIIFIMYSYFRLPLSRVTSASVGLILGGAMGNLIDRFLYGGIVDFFDFRIFPIFNVADSAISLGVIGILGYYVWEDVLKKRRKT